MFTAAKASKKRKTKAGISNETIFRLQFSLPKLRRIDSNKAAVARKNADCAKMSVEIAVPLFYFSHPRGVQKKTERTVCSDNKGRGGTPHVAAPPRRALVTRFLSLPRLAPEKDSPARVLFPLFPPRRARKVDKAPGRACWALGESRQQRRACSYATAERSHFYWRRLSRPPRCPNFVALTSVFTNKTLISSRRVEHFQLEPRTPCIAVSAFIRRCSGDIIE